MVHLFTHARVMLCVEMLRKGQKVRPDEVPWAGLGMICGYSVGAVLSFPFTVLKWQVLNQTW